MTSTDNVGIACYQVNLARLLLVLHSRKQSANETEKHCCILQRFHIKMTEVENGDVYVRLYEWFIKDKQSASVLRKQSEVIDIVFSSGFFCSENDLANLISKDIEETFLGNLPDSRDDGLLLEDYNLTEEENAWKQYSLEVVRSDDCPSSKDEFDHAVLAYMYGHDFWQ